MSKCSKKGFCVSVGESGSVYGDSVVVNVLGQKFSVEYHSIDFKLLQGISRKAIVHDLLGTPLDKSVTMYTSAEQGLYGLVCNRAHHLVKKGLMSPGQEVTEKGQSLFWSWKVKREGYNITGYGHSNPVELLSPDDWKKVFKRIGNRKLTRLYKQSPKTPKECVIHSQVVRAYNDRMEDAIAQERFLKSQTARNQKQLKILSAI